MKGRETAFTLRLSQLHQLAHESPERAESLASLEHRREQVHHAFPAARGGSPEADRS